MIYNLLQDPVLKTQLTKRPWLLLNPKEYFDTIISIWGHKKASTYQENLHKLPNTKNPAHFIAALGYDSLAYKSALKCFQVMKGYAIKGTVPTKGMTNFVIALTQLMQAKERDLNDFQWLPIPTTPVAQYCITGTLSIDRNEMITYLDRHNWAFSNQVSKYTDYLILGEIDHATTKSRKAAECNVPVIKEQDVWNLTAAEGEKEDDKELPGKTNS